MLASIKKMMAVFLLIIIQPEVAAIITKKLTFCLIREFKMVAIRPIVSASYQCDDPW